MTDTPPNIADVRDRFTWDDVPHAIAERTALTLHEARHYASPPIRDLGVHPWDWAGHVIVIKRTTTAAAEAEAFRQLYERGARDEDAALEALGVDLT